MSYKKALKELAKRENTTTKNIELEMQKAIELAGIDCSVKDFVNTVTKIIKEKTIYSI